MKNKLCKQPEEIQESLGKMNQGGKAKLRGKLCLNRKKVYYGTKMNEYFNIYSI